ncbi:MAG: substrate-binding domain-containing protein, partial [Tannerella sp.]|nr:substrate-binding domain-containing protein [Tannerella sp.]
MMKKVGFAILSVLFAIVMFTNCSKDDMSSVIIEGLTQENYPVMDGSTSTDPLVRMIACKLFGHSYEWKQEEDNQTWSLSTNLPDKFIENNLKNSQTHNAFINLIDSKVDMIFSARAQSADEAAYAAQTGVTLIEIPIALDALVFMNSKGNAPNPDWDNPVTALTHSQIQDIYTGRIKNWSEVGGKDDAIIPYIRNRNSGSQELMETLVMTEPITDEAELDYYYNEDHIIYQMVPVFSAISYNRQAIGYTVHYYKENIVRDWPAVKTLAINGIYPDKTTIGNRQYP